MAMICSEFCGIKLPLISFGGLLLLFYFVIVKSRQKRGQGERGNEKESNKKEKRNYQRERGIWVRKKQREREGLWVPKHSLPLTCTSPLSPSKFYLPPLHHTNVTPRTTLHPTLTPATHFSPHFHPPPFSQFYVPRRHTLSLPSLPPSTPEHCIFLKKFNFDCVHLIFFRYIFHIFLFHILLFVICFIIIIFFHFLSSSLLFSNPTFKTSTIHMFWRRCQVLKWHLRTTTTTTSCCLFASMTTGHKHINISGPLLLTDSRWQVGREYCIDDWVGV